MLPNQEPTDEQIDEIVRRVISGPCPAEGHGGRLVLAGWRAAEAENETLRASLDILELALVDIANRRPSDDMDGCPDIAMSALADAASVFPSQGAWRFAFGVNSVRPGDAALAAIAPPSAPEPVASVVASQRPLDPAVACLLGDKRQELYEGAPTPAADDLVDTLRNTPNWLRQDYGNWKDATSYYDRAPFDAADLIEQQAAEIARLRAVVRAADAMRADAYQEDMSSVGCPPNMVDRPTSVALAYDDARKDVTP